MPDVAGRVGCKVLNSNSEGFVVTEVVSSLASYVQPEKQCRSVPVCQAGSFSEPRLSPPPMPNGAVKKGIPQAVFKPD